MDELFPVAGSKFYIGSPAMATQLADFVEADFAAVVWTEVDGWETVGAIGDAAALITTALVNRNRDVKQKGTSNGGSMANSFARIDGDAGQVALRAAAAPSNKNNYPFRIDWSNDTKTYFVGLAMNSQKTGGGANTITKLDVTVEVNSNLVEV